LDHFLGDKGIYSTTADLFRWDQGLYSGKIINPDTLQLAFQPMGKRPKARSNYGYGWRIGKFGKSEIPIYFHSGWWHGFKTSLVRIPQDSATIVILRNNNRNGVGINRILDILYPSEDAANDDFEDADNSAAADSTSTFQSNE
ncbi:MAG: serine hydrolase, partial [Salinivirgaceae bacterium]|nr:serine hydrolase [Salinivirgaceae bacterium]